MRIKMKEGIICNPVIRLRYVEDTSHPYQNTESYIGMGWDMLLGTGVATALKVVQRHRPFLANPEGKAG